jgi:hypothetical protein
MSDLLGCQGRDLVISLLRCVAGRQRDNYLPQHREKHDSRASQELKQFLELVHLNGDVTYREAIDSIVDALMPQKYAPGVILH